MQLLNIGSEIFLTEDAVSRHMIGMGGIISQDSEIAGIGDIHVTG